MAQTIQLRNGTSTEWTTANPVLAEGELGLETDTNLYKIGDGATSWSSLPYREMSAVLASATFDAAAPDPTVGTAGLLRLYADSMGGRIMLRQLGPSGLSTTLQPAIYGNGMYIVAPGTSTVMNVLGGPALVVAGTMSHPNLVGGGLRVSTSRATVISTATANSIAEVRGPFARIYGGDLPGLGGYTVRIRFAFPSTTALQRGFAGITYLLTATVATSTVASLINMIGVGFESADSNLIMFNNDGAAAASRTDLGSNFPINSTAVYDLSLFSAANSGIVGWQVNRLDTSVPQAAGTFTTDIPAPGVFLAPHVWIANGGTAAAVQLDLMRIYLESDN